MRGQNKSALVLIFFGAVFFFTSCNNIRKNETIKIGVTVDLTGTNAEYGKQVKDGVELAVSEINGKGGINGKQIELDVQDSKSDAKLAVTNAQKFINIENAKVVIGEISSNATQAMIPVVEQNNAFLFAPASSSPKLTNASKNFARNWPSDVAEAGNAAEFAYNQFKSVSPLIVYVNSDYGIGLRDRFSEVFTKMGGKVVGSESFEVNASDFRTLLLKVRAQKFDCIYLAGNPKEMGNFMKQFGEMKMTSKIISNSGFVQPDCLNLAEKYADGVVVPTPSYLPNDSSNSKAVDFYKSYNEKYHRAPTLTDANAYDAVYLITEAIEKNGYDGLKIADYIRNLKDYEGVAGKVSFTNGDVDRQIVFKEIKDGVAVNYQMK